MSEPLGHERQITYFRIDGHDHDGENSTPVKLLPGSISLFHLNDQLKNWIRSLSGGSTGGGEDSVMPVPDLIFETPVIGSGGTYTGVLPWVGISVVRFMRILHSQDTECTITFYHKPSFLDEDREFRAYRCGNRFLWEGPWVHFDEQNTKSIYYKIENTGNQAATFQVWLKSGTMAANAYARFIESIQVDTSVITGPVKFLGGNGVDIEILDQNVIFNAVSPTTVLIERWTRTPVKPVSYSSSSTIGSVGNLSNGALTDFASFGSGLQWIMADLGSVLNLGGININQYISDGRVFNGVRVEISPDTTSWIEVKSSGTHWAVEHGMDIQLPDGILARYIRLWCNGSSVDANNYVTNIIPLVLSNKG